jgi:hypothetical protein
MSIRPLECDERMDIKSYRWEQLQPLKIHCDLTPIFDFSERILLRYVEALFLQFPKSYWILLISLRSLVSNNRMEVKSIQYEPPNQSNSTQVSHQYFCVFQLFSTGTFKPFLLFSKTLIWYFWCPIVHCSSMNEWTSKLTNETIYNH